MTYVEVERLSACAAQILSDKGIGRGDRVGIVIANVPAFVVWYFASLRVGAIAVSISTRLTGEEVAFILEDCGAKVVVGPDSIVELLRGETPGCVDQTILVSDDAMIVDGRSLESAASMAEGVFERMEPDDPATILYTSGTTGFPKGATLSHRNVIATTLAFNHLCRMQPEDRLLLSVPLFHCYGQNALLNSGLHAGATIVLQRRFDLSESKQLIQDRGVTMLFGVPMTFQLMLESCDQQDLSSIRYCFSAAAKLPESLGERWRDKFRMPIYEGYGLTETAPFASYNHRLEFVPGSIGTPVDLVEMKIVDPDSGITCPPRVPGEIAIRGPNVMLGYWNRPEETAEAVRDGWFYSGDIGQTDERGYFYIVDRLKDMIVIGALKVFPAEVERVLLEHSGVSEAAVVGMPDDVLGEKVVAFVVQATNAKGSEEDIRTHCGQHLGSYKVPGQVVFVDELPRNPAGKVLKTKLREVSLPGSSVTLPESNGDALSTLPATGPLVQRLQQTHAASRLRMLTSHVQEELRHLSERDDTPGVDELIMNDDVDSLMIVEFRDRLQQQVGARLSLPATLVFDHPRISDLAAHLLTALENEQALETAASPVQSQPSSHSRAVPDAAADAQRIEEMSEQQAMEALLREVNE